MYLLAKMQAESVYLAISTHFTPVSDNHPFSPEELEHLGESYLVTIPICSSSLTSCSLRGSCGILATLFKSQVEPGDPLWEHFSMSRCVWDKVDS